MLKSTPLLPALSGEPLQLARERVPLLGERDRESDETRRIPPHVMEAISATGLPWMMIPKRAGGAGQTMRCEIEGTAELATGSAGAAWAFGLLCAVTSLAGPLRRSAGERSFKTGRASVCGGTMPPATARPLGRRSY